MKWGGGAEQREERENPKQAPHLSMEPHMGLDLTKCERVRSWPELKLRVRCLISWATQGPLDLILKLKGDLQNFNLCISQPSVQMNCKYFVFSAKLNMWMTFFQHAWFFFTLIGLTLQIKLFPVSTRLSSCLLPFRCAYSHINKEPAVFLHFRPISLCSLGFLALKEPRFCHCYLQCLFLLTTCLSVAHWLLCPLFTCHNYVHIRQSELF